MHQEKKRLKTSEFIGKIIWEEVTLCLRLARAWTIYSVFASENLAV